MAEINEKQFKSVFKLFCNREMALNTDDPYKNFQIKMFLSFGNNFIGEPNLHVVLFLRDSKQEVAVSTFFVDCNEELLRSIVENQL